MPGQFSLFYIAFMREIPDPFSKKPHPCTGGSCLSELQIQLIVVFSAKTVGKQVQCYAVCYCNVPS